MSLTTTGLLVTFPSLLEALSPNISTKSTFFVWPQSVWKTGGNSLVFSKPPTTLQQQNLFEIKQIQSYPQSLEPAKSTCGFPVENFLCN